MVAPADAISLVALGLTHGPVERVFVPRNAFVTARVDQATNVVVVLSYPDAAALAAFLRRTLPTNGFTLTADDPATRTLTFVGFGWTGTFTGSADSSALLLRSA